MLHHKDFRAWRNEYHYTEEGMASVFDDKAEKQILDDYRKLARCLTTLGLTARRSQQFHPSFTFSYSFPVTFSHTVYPLLGSAELREDMQLLNIFTAHRILVFPHLASST
jgi:hypothetical protein